MLRGTIGRRVAALAGLAAAGGLLAAVHAAQAQQGAAGQSSLSTPQHPVFRAGAVLVTVDAYPQHNGLIVEGLKPGDFEILEDGKPQTVETFDFVRVEPGPAVEADRRDPNTQEEGNALAADPRNRVFVLYLDSYHVSVEGSHRSRAPLVDMLNRIMAPNDLFGVMTPAQRPSDLVLGRLTQSIDDQLTKFWPWGERNDPRRDPEEQWLEGCFTTPPTPGGDGQWWVDDDGQKRLLKDVLVDRRREDLVLTSLEALVGRLGQLREARTVVVLFTEGWVLYQPDQALANQVGRAPSPAPGITVTSGRLGLPSRASGYIDQSDCNSELLRLASLDDQRRLRDIVDLAARSNLSFYPANPTGAAAQDAPITTDITAPGEPGVARVRARVSSMRTLAEGTDGFAIVNTNDLAGGLRRIVNDVSAYYVLGYYSTNTKFDGKFRRIQVKLKQPGVTVRARRGYLAPKGLSQTGAAVPAAPVPPPAGPSPVEEALGALGRLRPTSELFTYGVATAADLLVAVELPSRLLESGQWAKGADVEVAVAGPHGEPVGTGRARIEPATRGALVRVPLGGAAGPWRASVSVRGAGDSLQDRIDVPASGGSLLGAPIIYRAAAGPRAPLHPVADFQFLRTERMHVEWPILAPLDQRQARLLGRTGRPLGVGATLTERDEGASGPVLAADVSLAPLAEGDYVMEVTAGRGAASQRALVAFHVAR